MITARTSGGGTDPDEPRRSRPSCSRAFPEAVTVAAYVGRFGWVNVGLDGLDPAIVREVLQAAWRSHGAKGWPRPGSTPDDDDARPVRHDDAAVAPTGTNDDGRRAPDRGRLRARPPARVAPR